MKTSQWNSSTILFRVAGMGAVSVVTLWLLFRLVPDSGDVKSMRVRDLLTNLSYGFVGIYLLLLMAQIAFRAARYKLFLKAGRIDPVSTMGILFRITLVRNMVIDLFPARLGELVYVALLRQVCSVSVAGGMTSAGFCLIFDVLSLWVLVVGLAVFQCVNGALSRTTLGLLAGLGGLSVVAGWGVMFGMPYVIGVTRWSSRLLKGRFGLNWILGVVVDAEHEMVQIRKGGIMWRALAWSMLVRLCKYTGHYLCFVAVTRTMMPDLANAGPWRVVLASIVSEAAASIPIPALMGFGLYEAGGTAIWVAFGFPMAEAVVAVLAAHILCQCIDYTLGGVGLLTVWRKPTIKSNSRTVPSA